MRSLQHFGTLRDDFLLPWREVFVKRQERVDKSVRQIFLGIKTRRSVIHGLFSGFQDIRRHGDGPQTCALRNPWWEPLARAFCAANILFAKLPRFNVRLRSDAIAGYRVGARLAGGDEKVCTHQKTEADDDSPNFARIGFLRVVRSKPSSAQGPDDHHHALAP